MIQIAGLGTSNLILARGFRFALETDNRICFTNFSVGASSSALLAERIPTINFSSFDFALFDFAVNEENFVRSGTSSLSIVRNNMMMAVDCASRAGCVPVLLLFPHATGVRREQPAADVMRDVFREAGAPSMDISKAVECSLLASRRVPADLFGDPNHLKRAAARMLGVELVERLLRFRRPDRHAWRETSGTYAKLKYLPFRSIAEVRPDMIVERSTSAFRFQPTFSK